MLFMTLYVTSQESEIGKHLRTQTLGNLKKAQEV